MDDHPGNDDHHTVGQTVRLAYFHQDSTAFQNAIGHPMVLNREARGVQSLIFTAIHQGRLNFLRMMVQNPGFDVNKRVMHAVGAGGEMDTPLGAACRRGNIHIVRILIESGANPAVTNRYGDTALHIAARLVSGPWFHEAVSEVMNDRMCSIIRILVEKDVSLIDQLNYARMSPVHLVAQRGPREMIALMLRKGARVDCVSGGPPYQTSTLEWIRARFPDMVHLVDHSGLFPRNDNPRRLYHQAVLSIVQSSLV